MGSFHVTNRCVYYGPELGAPNLLASTIAKDFEGYLNPTGVKL